MTRLTYDQALFESLFPVQESSSVFLFYDLEGKAKLRQDPIDKQEKRIPFLAYIGGQSEQELLAVASLLNADDFKIRKSKRLTQFPFELKLRGVSWKSVKNFVKGDKNCD